MGLGGPIGGILTDRSVNVLVMSNDLLNTSLQIWLEIGFLGPNTFLLRLLHTHDIFLVLCDSGKL